MTDITGFLDSAESVLKQRAEDFFCRIWKGVQLPSHDLDHHRRVWQNARDLTVKLSSLKSSELFSAEELFISCFFHDIGMSVDTGDRHGAVSRILCEQFLLENGMDRSPFERALKAIEEHDKKESGNLKPEISLASVLSAADDIDAFGFIGIFRYTEIYLKRGVSMSDLGRRVRENAAIRFENLVKNFGEISDIIEIQHKRFSILNHFFSEYDNEITGKRSGAEHYSLISAIKKMIEEGRSLSDNLIGDLGKSDNYIFRWFLEGYISESGNLNQSQATF